MPSFSISYIPKEFLFKPLTKEKFPASSVFQNTIKSLPKVQNSKASNIDIFIQRPILVYPICKVDNLCAETGKTRNGLFL